MLRAVTPDLVLDDEMYEMVAETLRSIAPERRLSWEEFIKRENWSLIPDVEHPDLPFFKAELIVLNQPPWRRTIKVNVWMAPDLRKNGAPVPHNHPWMHPQEPHVSFNAHVVLGGYREDRYEQHGDSIELQTRTHVAGDVNVIYKSTFHEVTQVLVPGATVTIMDCGPGIKEDWGYLNPDTGLYTPNKESPIDPRFKALIWDRNPHLRPQ